VALNSRRPSGRARSRTLWLSDTALAGRRRTKEAPGRFGGPGTVPGPPSAARHPPARPLAHAQSLCDLARRAAQGLKGHTGDPEGAGPGPCCAEVVDSPSRHLYLCRLMAVPNLRRRGRLAGSTPKDRAGSLRLLIVSASSPPRYGLLPRADLEPASSTTMDRPLIPIARQGGRMRIPVGHSTAPPQNRDKGPSLSLKSETARCCERRRAERIENQPLCGGAGEAAEFCSGS
jgi:hypothetical protein